MRHLHSYVVAIGIVALSIFPRTLSAQVTYKTLMLKGDQVPGMPDGVICNGTFFAGTNDAGDVAFTIFLKGPGIVDRVNDEALYIARGGELQMIARRGDQAIGALDGWVIGSLSGLQPVLGDGGTLAVVADVDGLALGQGATVIFSNRTGEFRVLVQSGERAPGMPEGQNFQSLCCNGEASVADNGYVVFTADLGADVADYDFEKDSSIWTDVNGTLEILAREGSPAPNTESGTIFKPIGGWRNSPFRYGPAINAAGTILFSALLEGTEDETHGGNALFSGKPGALEVVVRTGHVVPGFEPGVTFGGSMSGAINNSGQILFHSLLQGPGIDESNDDSLWVREPSGETRLIVRAGDPAPGRDQDIYFTRIRSFEMAINGNGHVVFVASITTVGSCIFVERDSGIEELACRGDRLPGLPQGTSVGSFNSFAMNSSGEVAFWVRLIGTSTNSDNNRGVWMADASGQLHKLTRTGDPFEVAPGDFRAPKFMDLLWNNGGETGRSRNFNDLGQYAFWASFGFEFGNGVFVASVVSDRDGDGIDDDVDTCPDENAAGLDANGDGCPDRLQDLPRVIREETSFPVIIQRPLIAIVNGAITALEHGNARAARQALSAFMFRIRAQRGMKIGDTDADMLVAFAANATAQLNDGRGLSSGKRRRSR